MSVSTVTSESLQLKLRQLLPSQQGFGTDLSASDTIVPIIDLTAAASGSDVRADLQSSLAFGSQTAFAVSNTTATIANVSGFYRVVGACSAYSSGTVENGIIRLSDGASTKDIWGAGFFGVSIAAVGNIVNFDFTIFLGVGESIIIVSQGAGAKMNGSVRQLADQNGTLIQPSGFTPQ